VIVSDDDGARLEAIVGDRNRSHKHLQRARPASAGRRCGAGNAGSPSKACAPCCATRPGRRERCRCRPTRWRGWPGPNPCTFVRISLLVSCPATSCDTFASECTAAVDGGTLADTTSDSSLSQSGTAQIARLGMTAIIGFPQRS
jgi:hypothetical protein